MLDSKASLNIFVLIQLACILLKLTIVSGPVLSVLNYTVTLWSLYVFCQIMLNIKYEPPVIKALAAFYILLAVYGLVVVAQGKTFVVGMRDVRTVVNLSYIVKVSWSLLPIFVFYQYSKKGLLTDLYMQKWIFVFVVVATISYFLVLEVAQMRHDEGDEATNNGGYEVLSLIPMLLFLKTRSIKQYLMFGYCLLLVFYSMKRGAILIGGITAMVYFVFLLRNSSRSARFSVLFALFIVMAGSYYYFDKMLATSEYFQERVDDTMEGDTSGRDVIQGFFIDYYLNEASTTEQVIGGGANRTLELFNMYAHNDWIELAINQGLIGMFLYLVFWIAFARVLFKRDIPPIERTALIMLFFIYFMKTLFSMSYSDYTLYSSMVLGYCLAVYREYSVA